LLPWFTLLTTGVQHIARVTHFTGFTPGTPPVVDPALLPDSGLVFFKLDRFEFDLGFDEFLDITYQARIAFGHERDCQTFSPARPVRPMRCT
jgi:hypothetical protein